jgi:hypothetical protein
MKRTIQLRISLRRLGISLPVLLAGAQLLSATTLVVGNCKSGGYPTIQQAITAAPVGATVQVCPGSYQEQVTINKAVTLQGISSNNSDVAIIYPPPGGLTQTTNNAYGNSVAYQVLVQNSSGAVNISNIIVDGTGNQVSGSDIAGIFYQNSSGTVNGVWAWHQSGNGFGIGIWLEGGSSSPSAILENSYVADTDFADILVETAGSPNSALTAKIMGNLLPVQSQYNIPGILVESGATSTVTSNTLISLPLSNGYGIVIGVGAAGSVSGNNIQNFGAGIQPMLTKFQLPPIGCRSPAPQLISKLRSAQ